MDQGQSHDIRQHRSLFLSDLHLGALGARADLLLKFLQRNLAQHYVLVGDILDIWHPALLHWTPTHQAVIDHLRSRHAAGAQLTYVRGNHDKAPDAAPADKRLPVQAALEALHETADGRRFLVVHGDGQDGRVFQAHLMTRLGSLLDQGLRSVDRALGRILWTSGPQRRSLIEFTLFCANALMCPGRAHERRLVALASDQGFDGVICGHFHKAELHDRHGLTYANCGDWMDSFTALAEDFSGRLTMIGGRAALAAAQRPPQAAGLVPA